VCGVRAAARLRALTHDDVDGLAQVARRFPEDFLAVARADAVERFQDRLLDGVDLGDVAKLATAPLGNGREMASRIEKIHIADVIRINRDADVSATTARFVLGLAGMGLFSVWLRCKIEKFSVVGHLTLALAIRPGTNPRLLWISSDRPARPRADKCDRKHGIRMFGCQSQTGRG
jgi:hypothetical protein